MSSQNPDVSAEFARMLEEHTPHLTSFIAKEATGLFRFESPEDLVQMVKLRALQSHDRYEPRGDGSFRAWLMTLARRTIADRHAHWQSLKRNCGALLSISFGQSSTGDPGGRLPAAPSAGPATWASRREMLVVAMKALSVLPEKDRKILLGMISGHDAAALSASLGLSSEALRKASARAEDRLRKTFRILLQK